LLFRSDKVAVRALFAKADRELPPSAIQKSAIGRTSAFRTAALHANQGRALTGDNATLCPNILAVKKQTKADRSHHEQKTIR
jgi:hypothetical protein